jgi:acyl-CoA thioester hydrolase
MVNPPTDRDVFVLPIKVTTSDIDDLNHVNNVVYVGWVQDAAAAHWKAVSSIELRSNCRWVVLRHEIDYLTPAFAGDQLAASTWVDIPNGPRQVRHVSIKRASDMKVLAYAQSTWCLLDPTSGRPKRISGEIVNVFQLKESR